MSWKDNAEFFFIVFGLSFFVVGAFFVVEAGLHYLAFRKVCEHGVKAQAQLHNLQRLQGNYAGDLSWSDEGGAKRTFRIILSKEFILNAKEHLRTDGVTIKYRVDDNSVEPVVVGDEVKTIGIIWVEVLSGVTCIAISILCAALMVFLLRAAARERQCAAARHAMDCAQRRTEEARKLLESLPFEKVIVSGQDAFVTWQRLRAEGRGYPVVLGTEEEVADLLETPQIKQEAWDSEVTRILEEACHLRYPSDLQGKICSDLELAREEIKELYTKDRKFSVPEVFFVGANGRRTKQSEAETRAWLLQQPDDDSHPLGKWSEAPNNEPGLSVVQEFIFEMRDGESTVREKIKDHVVIALLPVSHSYEVLGYLIYGNWNGCPPPQHHVAAQRSWSERYGAEIIGVSRDALNIKVTRKPETRQEALELAREHYLYCNDTINQGEGTLSNLAADLMQHEWWYFWWD